MTQETDGTGGTRGLLAGVALFLALAVPGASLEAQGVLVDEGEFRLMVRGLEVGSETFAIRRSGTGAEVRFTAQGRIVMEAPEGRLEIATTLGAKGVAAEPTGYQRNVSGARVEIVSFSLLGSRLVVRISSDAGEEMREVPVPAGGLLLEETIAHQFHFLVARYLAGDTRVQAIRPESRAVSVLELDERDPTTIQTRGGRIPVRRLRVTEGSRVWEVWFDSRGRVLRLENAVEGFRAERVSPPT
jgi:hypothetical protein